MDSTVIREIVLHEDLNAPFSCLMIRPQTLYDGLASWFSELGELSLNVLVEELVSKPKD